MTSQILKSTCSGHFKSSYFSYGPYFLITVVCTLSTALSSLICWMQYSWQIELTLATVEADLPGQKPYAKHDLSGYTHSLTEGRCRHTSMGTHLLALPSSPFYTVLWLIMYGSAMTCSSFFVATHWVALTVLLVLRNNAPCQICLEV